MLHNAAVVIRRAGILLVLAAGLIAVPTVSAEAATGPPTLDLNVKNGADLLDKVTAAGVLPGAVAGENVTIQIDASGRTLDKKQVAVGGDGSFSYTFPVDACCDYEVTATSAGLSSDPQRFTVGVPKHLRKGPIARLFNQKLAASRVTSGTRLALCAFRKVNNMARNFSYKPAIFRKLLMGRGEFVPRYHENHHVEVDISRQVMAFVDGDKVVAMGAKSFYSAVFADKELGRDKPVKADSCAAIRCRSGSGRSPPLSSAAE